MSPKPIGRLQMVGQDPAARSLDDLQVRARRADDTEAIGKLLNLAFMSWPTHHDWTPATVDDVAGATNEDDVGSVLELPGLGLVGVSLARNRPARFNDDDVTLTYVSVLGIHPVFRRRGLFRRLLEDTSARALASGSDILGLQTIERHLSATVFSRAGFRCVQPYHVVGTPLVPGPSQPTPEARPCALGDIPALGKHLDVLRDVQQHGARRPLHAMAWEDAGGGVAAIIWPVRARGAAGWETLHSCEIVRTWGHPTHAADQLRHVALSHGCMGLYQAPGTGPVFPGLFADTEPEQALRLLLGITEHGRHVAEHAIAWQPGFPSP